MNIIVGLLAIVIGPGLVFVGRGNVLTRSSSETGTRRLASRAAGGTGEHTGGMAAAQGGVRMLLGVGLIVFGIVVIVLG